MLRTITLSLLMLVSVVVMLPFASSTAHGLGRSYSSHSRRYRRHSRAWWRRHRARLRLRREAAALAAHRNSPLGPALVVPSNPQVAPAGLPKLPTGWNNASAASNGEVRFRA